MAAPSGTQLGSLAQSVAGAPPVRRGRRDSSTRAKRGQPLFWGGAACFWGEARDRLTPYPERFRQDVDCPVEGLMPAGHAELDSSRVIGGYLDELGTVAEPAVLYQIPFLERRIRLPEHLLIGSTR